VQKKLQTKTSVFDAVLVLLVCTWSRGLWFLFTPLNECESTGSRGLYCGTTTDGVG